MALDFPNTPALGNAYSVGGITWKWDGAKWISVFPTAGGTSGAPADVTQRAPTATDDSAHGYAAGDLWLFGEVVYNAVKVTPGLAVWQPVLAAAALPIDAIGGVAPVFAYGTMKLSAAYVGNSVNVVRTADNATLDVGFLSNGQMNLAALDAFSPNAPVRVATFYDQAGSNHATTVAAERPAMAASNLIGSARSVIFDAVHSSSAGPAKTSMTIPVVGAATGGALTFLTAIRAMDSSGINIYPAEFTGASFNFYGGFSATGDVWVLNRTGAQLQSFLTRPRCTPFVFGYTLSSSQTQFLVHNRVQAGTGTATTTALTAGTLGSSASGGPSTGGFETTVALAYARVLNATEMLNARASMTRLFRIYPQVRDVLLIAGDSITFGTFQSMNMDYTRRILPLLTTPMQVSVAGKFGVTLAAMEAGFDAYYDYTFNPNALHNVFTIFAGTNDIGGGATAAVTWDHMVSFCNKAHAAGWKIAIVTMLPRGSLTAPQQTEWASFNALIRANWATIADALIDPAADDVIGPQTATANTALYQDGIHPADGMPVYFAALFAKTINQLVAA